MGPKFRNDGCCLHLWMQRSHLKYLFNPQTSCSSRLQAPVFAPLGKTAKCICCYNYCWDVTGFEPRRFWSLDDRLTTTAAHKSQKLEYEELLSPAIARPPAMQEQLFRQLEPEFFENL